MSGREDLVARAKKKHAALARTWRSPRYRRVVGRYVAAGLLTTTHDVEPNREPLAIADVLWAGKTEPRLLELLPALIVKRPSLFQDVTDLPDDLADVVAHLRKNREPPPLRGVEGAAMLRWLPSVGHRGKVPSVLKSFRLQAGDVKLLETLSEELGISQTEVLRRGLRQLASSELLSR